MRRVALVLMGLFMLSIVAGTAIAQESVRTEMAPAASPLARAYFSMAYDSESDRVVLFGGFVRFGWRSLVDTWAYDLNTNTWTNLDPSPRPSINGDLAYDAESDRIIMFGGCCKEDGPTNETWAYDLNANTWTNMDPVSSPSRRGVRGMVYDSESDRVVFYGGWTGGATFSDETWAYDFNANTWTRMDPSTHPSALSAISAYDSESDRLIGFGGSDETWAYDFNANAWTNMVPSARPSTRTNIQAVYDSESDRVILFGGCCEEFGGRNNETWAYDFNTNSWTEMEPPTRPFAQGGQGVAYDAESDRVILFGGEKFGGETWAYDFNADSWTRMLPVNPPRNLQATAGDAQVDLTWNPPLYHGGSTITGYNIHRGTSSGGETFLTTVGFPAYTDTSVTNGVTYYYQVSAVNATGEGPRSFEASATPLVPDTTNPTVTITSPADDSNLATTSVTVSGTASDDVGVEKVELSTDGTNWVLATGTTSWSRTPTLTEGPSTIFARATDISGNTATVSIAVTVDTTPPGFQLSPSVAMFAGIGVVAAAAAVAIVLTRRRRRRREGGRSES